MWLNFERKESEFSQVLIGHLRDFGVALLRLCLVVLETNLERLVTIWVEAGAATAQNLRVCSDGAAVGPDDGNGNARYGKVQSL